MPAIFDSLIAHQHLSAHVAWRVSFIVPFIIIVVIAMGIIFAGDDNPVGKWADRHQVIDNLVAATPAEGSLPDVTTDDMVKSDKKDPEGAIRVSHAVVNAAEGEVIVAPTFKEAVGVLFSLQTLALAAPYACSFGESTSYIPANFKPTIHRR
jgi:NNP family nitrate/nitrite transporter-like MFS transporter